MRVSGPATAPGTGPDPAWGRLYQAGGISAGLFVMLLVAAIVLSLVTPPSPTAGGAATLEYIARHRSTYVVQQQLWLVPGVFAVVTCLALYVALEHVHRGYAAVGATLGGAAWALTLAMPTTSTGAPALVYLSDQYAATGDPVQQAIFVAAAENLIAQNRTPTAVGVLTTVGMVIVSLVMLQGVFPRGVAYLGIGTGVFGIASEALRPVIEGGYGVYGVLLLVWMGAVGWTLWRIGKRSGVTPQEQSTRVRDANFTARTNAVEHAATPHETRNDSMKRGTQSMTWLDLPWGFWNGVTAWIVLVVHAFGGWSEFPLYDVARNGNWYGFGFLLGAGSPFLGAAGAGARRRKDAS